MIFEWVRTVGLPCRICLSLLSPCRCVCVRVCDAVSGSGLRFGRAEEGPMRPKFQKSSLRLLPGSNQCHYDA